LSGTYQTGSEKMYDYYKNTYNINQSGTDNSLFRFPYARYRAVGGNSSLSLKINIPNTDISFIPSAYYRVLRYYQKNSERGLFLLNGRLDHTYGFSLTAAYLISFDTDRHRKIWIPGPELND